jgi:transformation/transcription domain-associated protein
VCLLADSSTVTELRDTADTTRDMPLYTSYLSHLLPAALALLAPTTGIPVSFTRDAIDQKLRHCLLTFIQKLPHTDPFRGYEKDVMDLMIRLLALENEENALVCVKVVIDGFRSHRVGCD